VAACHIFLPMLGVIGLPQVPKKGKKHMARVFIILIKQKFGCSMMMFAIVNDHITMFTLKYLSNRTKGKIAPFNDPSSIIETNH
jgi:hypothetical protein